jgi:hypothetical protein
VRTLSPKAVELRSGPTRPTTPAVVGQAVCRRLDGGRVRTDILTTTSTGPFIPERGGLSARGERPRRIGRGAFERQKSSIAGAAFALRRRPSLSLSATAAFAFVDTPTHRELTSLGGRPVETSGLVLQPFTVERFGTVALSEVPDDPGVGLRPCRNPLPRYAREPEKASSVRLPPGLYVPSSSRQRRCRRASSPCRSVS